MPVLLLLFSSVVNLKNGVLLTVQEWLPDVKLIVSVFSLLFSAGPEDEDPAGDFLDSAVFPGSQRSGFEIRQMPQTRCSGQLWCHQGEYWALYYFHCYKYTWIARGGYSEILCFLCSMLVSGMRSRSCQQLSRKVSVALPPTPWRVLVSSESSTESCCEYMSKTWGFVVIFILKLHLLPYCPSQQQMISFSWIT